jgi:hypothetical protein
MPKNKEKFPASPVGGKRGCLCKDNTYKSECCTGEMWEQGVGSLNNQTNGTVVHTNVPRVKINSYG